MSATDMKPIIKATDMEPEELHKVVELVDQAFKEPLKDHRQ